MKTIYYKTNTALETSGLPLYFGYININEDTLKGRHYKPKLAKLTESYVIGYYHLKGPKSDFEQIFHEQGDTQISKAEFEAYLAEWEAVSGGPSVCWGSSKVWDKISQPVA